ncbi:hypothetical protein DRJ17_07560 [Candidatus Woesearchaeota archaeon]|nr:MAG: hypothetical protein DRJ17_07560 [Candidatus Woesearchaeota archaeon]
MVAKYAMHANLVTFATGHVRAVNHALVAKAVILAKSAIHHAIHAIVAIAVMFANHVYRVMEHVSHAKFV